MSQREPDTWSPLTKPKTRILFLGSNIFAGYLQLLVLPQGHLCLLIASGACGVKPEWRFICPSHKAWWRKVTWSCWVIFIVEAHKTQQGGRDHNGTCGAHTTVSPQPFTLHLRKDRSHSLQKGMKAVLGTQKLPWCSTSALPLLALGRQG